MADLHREDGTNIKVGDRIVCDNCVATLKFIGKVPPTEGIWLGVEWDDPERGKHDGTKDGKTYFKTSHPTSGSFIRAKKATFGVSFMLAVRSRYGLIEDEDAGVETEDLFVKGVKNQVTVVEMVGARKVNDLQSKLEDLNEVVLQDLQIYGSPPTDDLATLVPSIQILNLSQNLIPSWNRIADITCQLKNLTSLNVGGNHLELPENPKELVTKLSHVTVLFLNRVKYTWSQILQCCDMFPRLEQLHACFNNIQELSSTEGRLGHVKLVNLESNDISDWSEIVKLGHLPSLTTLIVNDNKLSSIHFDSNKTASTDLFPHLTALSINDNSIKDWQSINELNKLTCLEELKIMRNPLMEIDTPETVRQLIVAKVKPLKLCNRTEVTTEERKGAEIDYLKRFGKEWMKSGGNQDINKSNPSSQFTTAHPRYQDLVNVWGPPEDSEMQMQSVSLKSNLINIIITCPSEPDKKPIEKKVPGTMAIGKIKALISRLLKLDSGSDLQLYYISQKMANVEIELDNDQRSLAYYSVESGDKIVVRCS